MSILITIRKNQSRMLYFKHFLMSLLSIFIVASVNEFRTSGTQSSRYSDAFHSRGICPSKFGAPKASVACKNHISTEMRPGGM